MLHITDHTLPPAGRAVVVSHGVNKGKGSAVKTSLGYAAEHGFDALVLLDGDGQHDPREIPGLLGPITTSTPEALTQASTTKSLSNDTADRVMPDARYNLEVGSGSGRHGGQTGRMMAGGMMLWTSLRGFQRVLFGADNIL